MNQLVIYRIATYILLPFGAFLGFGVLFMLLAALGNFALLLPVFIAGATVIYIFASLVFLGHVQKQSLCKHSLKDWILVNAYVALFMVVNLMANLVVVVFYPDSFRETVQHFMDTQGSSLSGISAAQMLRTVKGVLYVMGFLGMVLFVHIMLSFRLIKRNKDLFEH